RKNLRYHLHVKDIQFRPLIPPLQSNKLHLLLPSITPTKNPKKNVHFSHLYYQPKNIILSNKHPPIKNPEQLKPKTL
ncbi:transporter substrate-binding domain-containing protein, partial [Priestia megaterium]|uniref:transporter substrate-binding domain-containing protein n=1 Tax=Priestia megaterium TaxID=1404 RepID=UPI0012B76D17